MCNYKDFGVFMCSMCTVCGASRIHRPGSAFAGGSPMGYVCILWTKLQRLAELVFWDVTLT